MDTAIRISALCITAALLAALLRRSNSELALCLALVGGAVALYLAFDIAGAIIDAARRAREMSGLPATVFSPVVKCVAVGVISSVSASACRDAGSSELANTVELGGAVAALFCALPLIDSLLDTVEGLL